MKLEDRLARLSDEHLLKLMTLAQGRKVALRDNDAVSNFLTAAGIVSFVDQDGRVSIKYLSRQSKVGKLLKGGPPRRRSRRFCLSV